MVVWEAVSELKKKKKKKKGPPLIAAGAKSARSWGAVTEEGALPLRRPAEGGPLLLFFCLPSAIAAIA